MKNQVNDPVWYPYTRFGSDEPIEIKGGKKEFLFTADGTKIIDAVSSWWTNIHGHSHPPIVKAVSKQIAELDHLLFAGFTHKGAKDLASMLLDILPGKPSRIFYSDNGSTAVEVALKMAVQYWKNLASPRNKIIAFKGSYHGDTFGSMSVSERSTFTAPFSDLLFDSEFITPPYPGKEETSIAELNELLQKNKQQFAAFIYEPLVLGTAGMKMYEPSALERILAVMKQHDVLCIADEVMTGFGRTGKYFASEYMKQKPDIICLSKGITGGVLPLGATSATEKIYKAFADPSADKTFYHGHSYTGNPVTIAAAVASTRLFTTNDSIRKKTGEINKQHLIFKRSLKKVAGNYISEIRVRGTILAIEIKTDKGGYHFKGRDEMYRFFLEKGVLLRPLGNIIYIMPPYCISKASLGKVYKVITEYLSTLKTIA